MTTADDLCQTTSSVPNPQMFKLPAVSLGAFVGGRISDSLSEVSGVAAADANGMRFQLNVLSTNLSSIAASAKALATAATTGSIPSIQTMAVTGIVDALKQQVVSQVKQAVANQIVGILDQITAMSVDELQRNIAPVVEALNVINTIVGSIEAQAALASTVFSSQNCPARAELLAELYFKMKRG